MKNNNVPVPASDIPGQTGAMKNEPGQVSIKAQNKAVQDKPGTGNNHDLENGEYTKWWIHRIKLA